MADPQKDEHIEELLSKLQGIFGKLSHSDEEPDRKIEVPSPAPKEPEQKESDPPARPPEPEPAPRKPDPPAPLNFYEPQAQAPQTANHPVTPPAVEPAAPPAEPAPASGYETTVPTEDPEKMIVPAAVYFPPGRENEAKSLSQKLETMTPKFTKVAFRLRIGVFMPYDPKSDWKDPINAKARETKFQAVFVIVDRPLEDSRRKLIVGELEEKGVYFHDVLTPSIEKKAFYTDVLLGLVFFFDSRKPGPAKEE